MHLLEDMESENVKQAYTKTVLTAFHVKRRLAIYAWNVKDRISVQNVPLFIFLILKTRHAEIVNKLTAKAASNVITEENVKDVSKECL